MIDVVIIGCGAVTQDLHAPALQELERQKKVLVRAIFDPDPVQTLVLSSAFPEARQIDSLDALENYHNATVALIASPPRFHCEQAIACFQAGLSVLCEKPLATSVEEANRMIRAAASNNCILAVGHVRRHFPAAQLIKRAISNASLLGSLISFHVQEGGKFSWRVKSTSIFQRSGLMGGALFDAGIHTIDLLNWWLGEPRSFSYEDDAMGGIEINCRLLLDYGHVRGEVQITWDFEIDNSYYLQFENGFIRWAPYRPSQIEIGFTDFELTLSGGLSNLRSHSMAESRGELTYHQAFLPQWLHFLAVVQKKAGVVVSGEDAMQSIAFVEKCYASRKLLNSPWLSVTESDAAKRLARGNTL